MKYLLIFFLAGFFLADATLIKKYKLSLELQKAGFQGKVTLTLSDRDNNNVVVLDPYNYEVTKCIYTEKTNENTSTSPPTSVAQKEANCVFENSQIQFNGIRASEEVVLEFKGSYSNDGLSEHTTESIDRLYVADMSQNNHRIIFPCQEKVKAEFEFEGDHVVMSNLEKLRGEDNERKVFLRDIIFVRGDILQDKESIPNFSYYHMRNSEKIGPKLKNVMEKVAKLDASLQVLFTPISENIKIRSRDLIILRDALKTDDSKLDYSDIVHLLAQKLFQRPQKEKKTFLDCVGPIFAAMKISDGDPKAEEVLADLQLYALEKDGFNHSRSLNELASEHENTWANKILHPKGINVLYSLESICGDDKFTKGLSHYIKNGHSTAAEAFEGCFADKDKAGEFFKVWADDPGYPVVHVILNKAAEYNMNQERFLWLGSEEKNRRWIIPIDYKTKEGSGGTITLPATNNNVSVQINSTYFVLNHNRKGFYRVNYDAKIWEALISQLKSNHTTIDPVDRMLLIDDVFSFPKSTYNFNHGTPDYVTAFKLSDYLRNEKDFFALKTAFKAFDFLDSALNSSYHGKFRDHVKGILNGIYNNIIKEPPSKANDEFVKNELILLACKYGVEECMKNAIKTFKEITVNTTALSTGQKLAVCSAVRNDTTKWIESLALLSAMKMDTPGKIALLACSRDKTILTLFLTQFISQNDASSFQQAVFHAMERNPDNTKVILDIIKSLKDVIIKLWGEKNLEEIVKSALPRLNSESAVTLKEIAKDLDNLKEVNSVCENVKLWTNTKAVSVGAHFKGGGSQAKPIALLLLLTTLLPFANHIFHN